MKSLLRRIFGCHAGCCMTGGKTYYFNTVRGLVSWRWHCWAKSVREWPRDVKWRLANRLAWTAARLRGDHYYDCGYGIEANLAGMLEDSIRMKMVTWGIDREHSVDPGEGEEWKRAYAESLREEQREELNTLLEDLSQLAGLAKASTWVRYWEKSPKWEPAPPPKAEPKDQTFDY